MSSNDVLKDSEGKMGKCVDSTRGEFAAIRTGRSTPALLDRIHIDAYGASVPLKTVATISTPDARSLMIVAFDRNTIGEIRKAIEKSDLGLTPNVDGNTVRLNVPPLNEDRRKDLVKIVKKKAEDGKIAVRNVRHKAHDEIKTELRDHAITEDDNKRMQDQLQKLTDRFVKDIDALVAAKEKEIMEV